MSDMTYKRENIIEALRIAIYTQQQGEAKIFTNGGKSALLAGWETLLQDLTEGKEVKIQ